MTTVPITRSDLEPTADELRALCTTTTDVIVDSQFTPPQLGVAAPPTTPRPPGLGRPPALGAGFDATVEQLVSLCRSANNTLSGLDFRRVPGGGEITAVLGTAIVDAWNRFTGVDAEAGELGEVEAEHIGWWTEQFGLPDTAGGVLVPASSYATRDALVAARLDRLGHDFTGGVIYTSEQAHHVVALAGFAAGLAVHRVPTTPELRMDTDALTDLILRDRRRGLRPCAVVATAGTTATGAVDPLAEVAEVAERHGLWAHLDAAHGGGFVLAPHGRDILAGAGRYASIAFDGHKALSLPYTVGGLLVADPAPLEAAFGGWASYLPQRSRDPRRPDFATREFGLSRETRLARLWVPLHTHGLDRFGAHLEEKLDLARHVEQHLRANPAVELPYPRDLSTLVFRVPGADPATLVARLAQQGIGMSVVDIADTSLIHMCVLSHRTHLEHVDYTLAVLDDLVQPRGREA